MMSEDELERAQESAWRRQQKQLILDRADQVVRTMTADGHTRREMALRLGRSENFIDASLRRLGLTVQRPSRMTNRYRMGRHANAQ